jgi:hypothetical protein
MKVNYERLKTLEQEANQWAYQKSFNMVDESLRNWFFIHEDAPEKEKVEKFLLELGVLEIEETDEKKDVQLRFQMQ